MDVLYLSSFVLEAQKQVTRCLANMLQSQRSKHSDLRRTKTPRRRVNRSPARGRRSEGRWDVCARSHSHVCY